MSCVADYKLYRVPHHLQKRKKKWPLGADTESRETKSVQGSKEAFYVRLMKVNVPSLG